MAQMLLTKNDEQKAELGNVERMPIFDGASVSSLFQTRLGLGQSHCRKLT